MLQHLKIDQLLGYMKESEADRVTFKKKQFLMQYATMQITILIDFVRKSALNMHPNEKTFYDFVVALISMVTT